MLERVFSMDNWFMKALEVACDLIVLNILTVLCCIPVITSGAAITALNDMVWHRIRGEESYIIKGYFKSFRANFKKGTILGMLFMLMAVVLWVDYKVVGGEYAPFRTAVLAAAVCMLAVMLYSFALLSRYENTVINTLKNAVLVAIGFFPRTVVMVAMVALFAGVVLYYLQYTVPVLLLFGVSLPCYLSGLMYNGVFEIVDKKEKEKEG